MSLDWACFLRNKSHLSSFTFVILVFGWYSPQTSFSIPSNVLSFGSAVVPRSRSALILSSSAFMKPFQHKTLDFALKKVKINIFVLLHFFVTLGYVSRFIFKSFTCKTSSNISSTPCVEIQGGPPF